MKMEDLSKLTIELYTEVSLHLTGKGYPNVLDSTSIDVKNPREKRVTFSVVLLEELSMTSDKIRDKYKLPDKFKGHPINYYPTDELTGLQKI